MADIPANASTTAIIEVGGILNSTIGQQSAGDRDWVRIDLTAGEIITIAVDARGANGLTDSVVQIRDADGKILELNDDTATGSNSELLFLTPQSGTYYITVKGYDAEQRGDYRLSVVESELPVDILPALDWNSAQADTDVTVYFAAAGRTFDGFTAEGFNAYEKERFQQAFDLISAATGLTFRTVDRASEADLKLVLDLNEGEGDFLGYFNPPGEANEGVGVFDGRQWDRAPGGSLDAGGYDFVTIVHELLHGMGLAHPHDNGGGSAVFPGVSAENDDFGYLSLNQGVFTTMSYNTGYPDVIAGHDGEKWGFEYGPMALDIAVLQQKYGANRDWATGDDTYVLPGSNKVGTFFQAIWDAGGTDTITYDGRRDAVIDLREATLRYEVGGGGFVSSATGIAGGFTIAAGAVIENAIGGAGRDTLVGNDGQNALSGRAGDDRLSGGENRDRLKGGDGDDALRGGDGRDWLSGGSGADNLTGGSGRDRFVFAAGHSDAADRDVIRDFGGHDMIDLRSFGALAFVGSDPFDASGAGQARYHVEGSYAVLAVDANGDGTADLAVRLNRVSVLELADFMLG